MGLLRANVSVMGLLRANVLFRITNNYNEIEVPSIKGIFVDNYTGKV